MYQDQCSVILSAHLLYSKPPDPLRSPYTDHNCYRRSLDRGLGYPYRPSMRHPLLSALDELSRLCRILPQNIVGILAWFSGVRFSFRYMDTFPATASSERQTGNRIEPLKADLIRFGLSKRRSNVESASWAYFFWL